ncbi:excalibur calcium-binding domain-containing protein [Aureimonas populi]|uniref:Excalibur calcium-binding domain-containing protein n=1 Tax=Aureimonas populi TaxID=1701758 RepID=A0ABW5CKS1_9HYPH|nr:excalibur calcium-binding domain-containing protein [Aureimonas populi]
MLTVMILGVVMAGADAPRVGSAQERLESQWRLAQRRPSCQTVSSCREAVILWCDGYSRADGDNDGIPCENVCRSLAEVDEIRAEIGC